MAKLSTSGRVTSDMRHNAVLVGLLFAMLVFGGASRADALNQTFVRCLAIATLVATWWRPLPSRSSVGPIWLLLGAWTAMIAIQLVPLPPSVWSILPGREILVSYHHALAQPFGWRPLSMVPQVTLNALFALLPAWAAVSLVARRLWRNSATLETVILAFLLTSMAIGAVQFISGGQSLYFYEITNRGWPVGLFSNRNHNAFMLVLILPLVARAVLRGSAGETVKPAKVGMILASSLMVMVYVLITGSRMGIVLFLVAAACTAALLKPHWAPLRKRETNGRRPFPALAWLVIGVCALMILGYFTFVNVDRFTALIRVSETGLEEKRLAYIPVIVTMIQHYFPFGSGFGTFPAIYKVFEPDGLLGLSYLNHAHNDILEIVVEGGLVAMIIAVAFFGFWTRATIAVWRRKGGDCKADTITQARLGSIVSGLLMLASATDYPLRTPACLIVFAIACCWLLASDWKGLSST